MCVVVDGALQLHRSARAGLLLFLLFQLLLSP